MNQDDLESWAVRACEELQDFCNEAQLSAGDPDGEGCLPGTRALLAEADAIFTGKPVWPAQVVEADMPIDWKTGITAMDNNY